MLQLSLISYKYQGISFESYYLVLGKFLIFSWIRKWYTNPNLDLLKISHYLYFPQLILYWNIKDLTSLN